MMYKNLSAEGLGIFGRQSELIELSLTYGFRGLDLDILDLVKRAQTQGVAQACRFLKSAQIEVGGFELPIRWLADDATFKADLPQLQTALEISSFLGGKGCYAMIQPGSDDLPYHENFELHRRRLAEVAGLLAKHEMRLGLGLLAAPAHRLEKRFEFINQADALLTLIKTIGAPNIGLLFDTWNWRVGGGSLDQLRDRGRDFIVAVRIADAPADIDPATAEETDRLLPTDGGAADIPGVMQLLGELEYEGPVSLFPHPSRFEGRTREANVQTAKGILEDLFKIAYPVDEALTEPVAG
jgi:sugar phosphate isomerase/epimerase